MLQWWFLMVFCRFIPLPSQFCPVELPPPSLIWTFFCFLWTLVGLRLASLDHHPCLCLKRLPLCPPWIFWAVTCLLTGRCEFSHRCFICWSLRLFVERRCASRAAALRFLSCFFSNVLSCWRASPRRAQSISERKRGKAGVCLSLSPPTTSHLEVFGAFFPL